jgi:uncharacterized protein
MALAAMWAGAIITHLVVDGEVTGPVLAEPLSDRINGN